MIKLDKCKEVTAVLKQFSKNFKQLEVRQKLVLVLMYVY